ncbi:uncharacterized protein LOC129402445 [Sorex araneus]|uniref:uncharacterized protein LOC129402445 n=1 Tax=Sorex araneus TaxID=42254 RepID=UPI002433EA76|nr:uncharacterized protein LOC129402445 [Sorex araneus]
MPRRPDGCHGGGLLCARLCDPHTLLARLGRDFSASLRPEKVSDRSVVTQLGGDSRPCSRDESSPSPDHPPSAGASPEPAPWGVTPVLLALGPLGPARGKPELPPSAQEGVRPPRTARLRHPPRRAGRGARERQGASVPSHPRHTPPNLLPREPRCPQEAFPECPRTLPPRPCPSRTRGDLLPGEHQEGPAEPGATRPARPASSVRAWGVAGTRGTTPQCSGVSRATPARPGMEPGSFHTRMCPDQSPGARGSASLSTRHRTPLSRRAHTHTHWHTGAHTTHTQAHTGTHSGTHRHPTGIHTCTHNTHIHTGTHTCI